jgi:hypothetical protein
MIGLLGTERHDQTVSSVLEWTLEERALMLKAPVERVIEEPAREVLPVYIWRDGKVVAVPAEEPRTHP